MRLKAFACKPESAPPQRTCRTPQVTAFGRHNIAMCRVEAYAAYKHMTTCHQISCMLGRIQGEGQGPHSRPGLLRRRCLRMCRWRKSSTAHCSAQREPGGPCTLALLVLGTLRVYMLTDTSTKARKHMLQLTKNAQQKGLPVAQ